MPEFDEDTHKRKSRNDQELKYEPGKNADKYKSTKPGFQKKSRDESSKTSSLWVEAATNTPYKNPKPEKKGPKSRPDKRKYSNSKGRSGNRNQRWTRRKKPSLWQRILRFFGIASKKPNRRYEGKRGSKNQPQKTVIRKRGDNRSGQPRPQSGGNRRDDRRGRQGDSSQTPRSEGEGPRRRKRTRKPDEESRQYSDSESTSGEATDKRESRPRREDNRQEQRPERGNKRPPRSHDRESRPRSENREPRERATPARVESIAAPKTDTSSLTLGAVDMGGSASKEEAVNPKVSTPRGKRNRRATGRPQAGPVASTEFVPHPIEISTKPDKSDEKTESES